VAVINQTMQDQLFPHESAIRHHFGIGEDPAHGNDIACIGIYGLLTYSVRRRTNEIGIRLALGAQSNTLLWMVLRESVVLLLIGLAMGIPVALATTGILRKMLFQLSPNDPFAFTAAGLIVAAMTLLAAWHPARRATRVDPMQALRCD
jgi:ABC-type antimicrobial peptide transport system permease subunit